MKLVRYSIAGEASVRGGVLEEDVIREYVGDMFEGIELTGSTCPLADATLHAPLSPRHIIGIGANFAPEGVPKPDMPELPVLFFKPTTAVIGPGVPIRLPPGAKNVKFEAELCVVIGRTGRRIAPERADEYIFGFTVANDVSAPEFFHPNGHWTVGKSFDTFCPLGPWLDTAFDDRDARIRAAVNGVEKQNGSIERMITPVRHMISRVSEFMTLMPGDVLLTGTPPGADVIRDGDTVVCAIEGLGSLSNPVLASAE